MTREHPNHKWLTLFAMCFALFMIMLDNTVVNVALPSIQHQLHVGQANLLWTINAYVLTFAVLILLGGKLGDRFGRKRIFLVGLTIFTLSSMACALATSDTQLIVFRAIQGSGGALMNPLSLSIIVNAFPRKEVPTAIGIWAGISGLGLAIGPLLGGFLVDQFDWSAVFWINVPIGIVAMGVTLWAVTESNDPSARSLDIPGTVLVTAGLFSLVWALVKTTSHAWVSVYTLGFIAAAIVLLVTFVIWESRAAEPMIPLEFFRSRAFDIASLVVTLVGFALFGIIFFLALYLQDVRGYSPQAAGLRMLPMTAMVVLVAPIGGRLNSRVGPRPLMAVGMGAAALALAGLAQLHPDSSYNAIWPFFLLAGAGIALTMPTTTSTAMGSVDGEKAGIASGVVNASRQVGGALGISVLGSVGATIATSTWHTKIANLPAAAHAQALKATPAVISARIDIVSQHGGTHAADLARDAFTSGLRGAMWVGAFLCLAACVTSIVGLAGFRPRTASAPAPQPVAEV